MVDRHHAAVSCNGRFHARCAGATRPCVSAWHIRNAALRTATENDIALGDDGALFSARRQLRADILSDARLGAATHELDGYICSCNAVFSREYCF